MEAQITQAMLMQIHGELYDKLKKVVGKPLMITVTYKDETTTKLEHWICQNNDFADSDVVATLNHLLDEADQKSNTENKLVVLNLHEQLRAKKIRADKRLRS